MNVLLLILKDFGVLKPQIVNNISSKQPWTNYRKKNLLPIISFKGKEFIVKLMVLFPVFSETQSYRLKIRDKREIAPTDSTPFSYLWLVWLKWKENIL